MPRYARLERARLPTSLSEDLACYGTWTVNSPGATMLMTPPHMHISCDALSRVGTPPSSTVGPPGTHGAGVFGMHGIGVRTPSAAVVAAATVGLAGEMQGPNGMMFTKRTLSMMVASGIELVSVLLVGSTTSELGASPKVHIIIAPAHTCIGMLDTSCEFFSILPARTIREVNTTLTLILSLTEGEGIYCDPLAPGRGRSPG